MSESVAVFPAPRPLIRRVPVDRPWTWLAAGWRDIVAAPGASLAYGVVPVVGRAGWPFSLLLWLDLPYLVLPLSAGFFFVGPFMAVRALRDQPAARGPICRSTASPRCWPGGAIPSRSR